jgi:hypothetical protein
MNPKMMSYDDLLHAVNERYRAVGKMNEDSEVIKLLMKEFKLSRLEVYEFLGFTDEWNAENHK